MTAQDAQRNHCPCLRFVQPFVLVLAFLASRSDGGRPSWALPTGLAEPLLISEELHHEVMHFLTKVTKAYMSLISDGKTGIFCEDALENPQNWSIQNSTWRIRSFNDESPFWE